MNSTYKGALFKYVALREWILQKIDNRDFKFGDKLPSENLLCNKFGISRQTVRNAIDDLEKEGIVRRIRGSGMFVSKSLNQFRDKTIAILVSYINEYIYPSIIHGVEEVLTENGYGMDLGLTYNKVDAERRFLERIINSNVSGLLVEGTKTALPNPNIDLYQEIIKKDIPIVFMHNYYPELENSCPAILVEDFLCVKKLTNMLIQNGHKKIAGVFKFDDLQGVMRYKGYITALIEAGISVEDEYIKWFSIYPKTDSQEMEMIVEKVKQCTAVVCYNDKVASQVFENLRKKKINVPDDISMVGFDDMFSEAPSRFRLTTVRHPQKSLGIMSAQAIMSAVLEKEDKLENEKYLMNASIINRDSIKNIKKDEKK